ncbi:MAG: competence protein ComEA [Microgenomates group bacterium Gr01-1014_93]|nr:MAG: competence protein ComEA [Microgenomates group bacterium Gr01-1014_93]
MQDIYAKIEQFRIPIGLSLVGIVLIIGGMVASGIGRPSNQVKSQDFPKESLVAPQKISVDVSGAVNSPGVYELQADARVEDAIKSAGGFTDSANAQYISKSLNLAQKLSDGAKIYIPRVGESISAGSGLQTAGSVAGASAKASVNINSASQSDLESLPGIGPVTAAKIISGRPYAKTEDLLNQKIVSKATFEKIKDQLTI